MPRLLMPLLMFVAASCSGAIVQERPRVPEPTPLNEPTPPKVPGDAPPVLPDPALPKKPVPPSMDACAAPRGPARMRRLTRFEYDNVLSDLLGVTGSPAARFPAEEQVLGFDNNIETLGTGRLLADNHAASAERVAAKAVEDLRGLLGSCAGSTVSDECAHAFIRDFGLRAFRRPLDAREQAVFERLYGAGNSSDGPATGVRLVVQAMLQSPKFLYRIEGAEGPDAWDLGSRLSFLLWGSTPDRQLLETAASGRLRSAAEMGVQARRMLADPRARRMVAHFHRQWLMLDRIETTEKAVDMFPRYNTILKPLLTAQAEMFLDHVIWEGDGTVRGLLTTPVTFLDATLAGIYGGTSTSPTLVKTRPVAGRGAGFLTLPGPLSVLALPKQTSPVYRGHFVRTQWLCETPPPPPDDADIKPPELSATLTTRERFAEHTNDFGCNACHKLMDPIGLGFEKFDTIGRWRDKENNRPVDASGEIVGTDVPGTFDGVAQLAERLSDSQQVHACVATQWFRYAFGQAETAADRCFIDQLTMALRGEGGVRSLLLALAQSDRIRGTTEGER